MPTVKPGGALKSMLEAAVMVRDIVSMETALLAEIVTLKDVVPAVGPAVTVYSQPSRLTLLIMTGFTPVALEQVSLKEPLEA